MNLPNRNQKGMNQQHEKEKQFPKFLTLKYPEAVYLLQDRPEITEMLKDYRQLQNAVEYWSGLSEKKVEEFNCMLDTLQRDIIEAIEEPIVVPQGRKNQKGQG